MSYALAQCRRRRRLSSLTEVKRMHPLCVPHFFSPTPPGCLTFTVAATIGRQIWRQIECGRVGTVCTPGAMHFSRPAGVRQRPARYATQRISHRPYPLLYLDRIDRPRIRSDRSSCINIHRATVNFIPPATPSRHRCVVLFRVKYRRGVNGSYARDRAVNLIFATVCLINLDNNVDYDYGCCIPPGQRTAETAVALNIIRRRRHHHRTRPSARR